MAKRKNKKKSPQPPPRQPPSPDKVILGLPHKPPSSPPSPIARSVALEPPPSPSKKHSRHSSLPPTTRYVASDFPPLVKNIPTKSVFPQIHALGKVPLAPVGVEHHTPHVPLVLVSQPPSLEIPIPNNPLSSPHLSSPSIELSSADEASSADDFEVAESSSGDSDGDSCDSSELGPEEVPISPPPATNGATSPISSPRVLADAAVPPFAPLGQ